MRGLCVCCTVAAVVFCVHGSHRPLPLPSKSGILKCPTNATTMYAREYRARVVLCVRMRACFHLIVYFAVAATTSSPWLGTAKKWWMACWRSTGCVVLHVLVLAPSSRRLHSYNCVHVTIMSDRSQLLGHVLG